MSNSARLPSLTVDRAPAPAQASRSSLRLQCPACRRDFPQDLFSSAPRLCSGCGFTISEEQGILRALEPDREFYFQQFVHQYETVRAKEGRGSSSEEYYLALPFRDLTGKNSWQWQIRSRTFRYLENYVLRDIERTCEGGCDVLDIGAGNCWLSYRMVLRGHRPVAVDLLDNDADGLGAATHYFGHLPYPFPRFQAEMDRLPLASGQFDVVVFNASFHYSVDYERTLSEALRCLRRPGHVVIADSPFYSSDASGRKMVEEKRAGFERQFGFRSDSIESREYLTPQVLGELARKFGLRWKVLKPWYGVNWAMRPVKARLLLRRPPARFYIVWGKGYGQ